jgi:hypothetical protein
MRARWLFGGLVAIAGIIACVPSSEEVYPRGAVNVIATPSAGTRGEPFMTSDGWTIRVSAMVLQTLIGGQGPPPNMISNGAVHLFHASKRQEFVIPRIDEGAAKALLSLTSLGIGPDYARIPGYYSGANRDVEPSLIARFAKLADDEDPSPPEDDPSTPEFDESTTVATENGPALLLTGQAEKEGRVIRFDFTLQASFVDAELPVKVNRNVLNDVVVTIAVEQLFNRKTRCRIGRQPILVGQPRTTELMFDEVAAADKDGDGVLSPAELRDDEGKKRARDARRSKDGGVEDGSFDAGSDAGMDAGGSDAGSDAGSDEEPASVAETLRDHACLIFMSPNGE